MINLFENVEYGKKIICEQCRKNIDCICSVSLFLLQRCVCVSFCACFWVLRCNICMQYFSSESLQNYIGKDLIASENCE